MFRPAVACVSLVKRCKFEGSSVPRDPRAIRIVGIGVSPNLERLELGGTGIPCNPHEMTSHVDACGIRGTRCPRNANAPGSEGNGFPPKRAVTKIEGKPFPPNADRLTCVAMPRKTNAERMAKYKGLLRGVKKRWSSSAPRILLDKQYSSADIVALLQSMIDAIQGTASAHAAWRDRVTEQRELEKSLHDIVRAVEEFVRTEAGDNATALAAFGLQPARKTGPRTTDAKLVMVERAKATRVIRKTMGKRQRLKVRG